MDKQLSVKVTYRNERLEPVYEKTYSLTDYTDMLRIDLLRLITDVEEMAYELNGNKPKEQWSDETWGLFCRIKHKLLDKAGDIGRLPSNLCSDDPNTQRDSNESLSSFIASVLDQRS